MRKLIVMVAILITSLIVFQLSSCSGGGGGGGGSGATLANTAENQNTHAREFFTKLEDLISATLAAENLMAIASPTDKETQDQIVRTVEEVLLPQTIEAYAAGQKIFDDENTLQGLASSSRTDDPRRSPERRNELVLLASAFGACVALVSAVSAWDSLKDNHTTYVEQWNACGQTRRNEINAIPTNISEQELDARFEDAWARYEDCVDTADESTTWEDTKVGVAYVLGEVAPGLFASRFGRVSIKTIDASLDTTNVFVYGTNPDSGGAQRSNARSHNSPDNFFAKTDANGEFIAPAGDWRMVAFTPGYVRFGTPEGQWARISENETHEVDVNSVRTGSAAGQDLATCDTGGGTGAGDSGDGGGTDTDSITFPIRYSGVVNRINFISTTCGAGGSVECQEFSPMEITLNADGTGTVTWVQFRSAVYDCGGVSGCQDFGGDELTRSVTHANGQFSFDLYTGVTVSGTYDAFGIQGSLSPDDSEDTASGIGCLAGDCSATSSTGMSFNIATAQ